MLTLLRICSNLFEFGWHGFVQFVFLKEFVLLVNAGRSVLNGRDSFRTVCVFRGFVSLVNAGRSVLKGTESCVYPLVHVDVDSSYCSQNWSSCFEQ